MASLQKNSSEYTRMVSSVASYLEGKGYQHIRADVAEFEKPSRLLKKGSDDAIMPDLTARKNNGKCYFELVTAEEEGETAGKWQLLSSLAEAHNGKFFVLVPYGKMSYTHRLLADHAINAEVVKLQGIL